MNMFLDLFFLTLSSLIVALLLFHFIFEPILCLIFKVKYDIRDWSQGVIGWLK